MRTEWVELVQTPAGWCIAAGAGALTALSFPYQDRESARWVAAAEYAGPKEGAPEMVINPLRGFLEELFGGREPRQAVPVSVEGLPPFTRKVLEETRRIGWGTVCTYGEMARRVGRPGGAQAVGQALGRNPVPLVIPCHRVVAQGGIGGFGGGLCWKRRLLRLEGAGFD